MASMLRVAAVQVRSDNGAIEENLERARHYVVEAAVRGAQLVLCPEFLAAGYVYDESIWRSAEPAGGPTERWLASLAREHDIMVGATFLEAEGSDFHNTFALFDAAGLVGRVRKRSLPFFEGWFVTSCARSKVIATPLGHIAVGICADNQTADFFRDVQAHAPDLLLMPHSAPTPCLPPVAGVVARVFREQLRNTPRYYAETFGIPVVMSNKVSLARGRSSLPLVPGVRISWTFDGYSSIHDAGGRELAFLADREGVLVADVRVDPERKRAPARPPGGYWSLAPRVFPRTGAAMFRVLAALGRRSYRRNPRRPGAAARVAIATRPEQRVAALQDAPCPADSSPDSARTAMVCGDEGPAAERSS